ncbi:hypothetical protein TVAG_208870 [Trichomonas vaginalis G3]|uniref:Uncharacterized protein n=1 Tax=Trichomonas vaginalis (strain ATCC PRA-98 / G3) TaxID=412133 RepID=A2DVC9_TRIV3|nr:hypothetical protein TVAGG3_0335170 [Trichomonas vaginalis G3]EAY15608.1 hypothetical protein TVAG_208870 [Trichomonas vaginalis G3]KAI5530215.1 hypothetical protein TVAGG3_0335170 [Trichomonas vaginalis G3]|eukprot:XP_001327831.1 hypothetical protein [Trichomonas vaginalis G3]
MSDLSQKRPATVTFDVDYHRPTTRSGIRTATSGTRDKSNLKSPKRTVTQNLKTADLSHITDQKEIPNVPTFIPDEFNKVVATPIPIRPGTSQLDPESNQWMTKVFPSPEPSNTREEVEHLGQWLNTVLEKNQKESKDPIELASNARNWFTIAYEELCRQVSVECPERSTLLLSIWRRYQELFARVVQLHQEEKTYLVTCHKERTQILKDQLEVSQSRLKQITQQYRDDQERWSNVRERDETKFANMRKKLDLQVKNKRSLQMQIKILRDQLERPKSNKNSQEKFDLKEPEKHEEEEEKAVEINERYISDKTHAFRGRVRKDFPQYHDIVNMLDDISRYVDQERTPANITREQFPTIFQTVPPLRIPKIRTLKWVLAALSYFYAARLTELSDRRIVKDWNPNRQHFAEDIYEIFLVIFGNPQEAAETFFDLIESARVYAEEGNLRCKHFLQFVDVIQPYRDCVYLDYYCFCLGCFMITNASQGVLFKDEFDGAEVKLSPVNGALAIDLLKKVLYSVSDSAFAESFVTKMRNELVIPEGKEFDVTVSEDQVLDILIMAYAAEESRMTDQIREQYEMDAAQFGGIVTFGQFQTLAMFSSRKLDTRSYIEMMRETLAKMKSETISLAALIDAMHKRAMLVPFSFERVDYDVNDHQDDMFKFIKEEYEFHLPEIESKLEDLAKADEGLFKQLQAAKTKFDQVIESKRIGFFTEVAQRDIYMKLRSIHVD